jgi:LysM repeat protein
MDGNQVSEESTTVDGNDNLVHTVTQTTYDSHNRLSTVVETDVLTGATTLDETFSYDAAGNRREVEATSDGTTQDAWYTYDGDNRVQVSDGSLSDGQILVTDTADSYEQFYDANGNVTSQLTVNAAGDTLVQRSYYDGRNERVRADYAVDTSTGGAFAGVEETVSYDADGHALITDTYYALGTMLGTRPTKDVSPDDPLGTQDGGTDVGGMLDAATIDTYDGVGRLAEEQDFGHPSNWDGSGGSAAPTTPPGVDATSFGSLGLQSAVVYQGVNGSAGYDADGDVVAYQYRDASGRVDQYAVTYLRKDSYLQSTTSGLNISNTPNVRPTTDESVYDTRGDLVALAQHTQYAGGTVADTVRVFAYDGNGQIIERRDGTADGATLDQGSTPAHENQHYVYVNGQQVAHYDDAGTLDVLDEVTAFSSHNDSPDSYVVQAGDTLQSIAQAEYGDASLWYVIAQANALSDSNDLSIGQKLTIPSVTTHSNSATTFQPYDPSRVVGSTTPNLPTIAPPPPPPSSQCNVLAEIVVIAVVVVVSYFTAGALSGASASLGSSILAGAAAGAAGSAAGQLTGDALGVHQGFSFGELAVGAAGGAIAGGVSYGVGQSSVLTSSTQGADGAGAAAGGSGASLNAAGYAVEGAANYVDEWWCTCFRRVEGGIFLGITRPYGNGLNISPRVAMSVSTTSVSWVALSSACCELLDDSVFSRNRQRFAA